MPVSRRPICTGQLPSFEIHMISRPGLETRDGVVGIHSAGCVDQQSELKRRHHLSYLMPEVGIMLSKFGPYSLHLKRCSRMPRLTCVYSSLSKFYSFLPVSLTILIPRRRTAPQVLLLVHWPRRSTHDILYPEQLEVQFNSIHLSNLKLSLLIRTICPRE